MPAAQIPQATAANFNTGQALCSDVRDVGIWCRVIKAEPHWRAAVAGVAGCRYLLYQST